MKVRNLNCTQLGNLILTFIPKSNNTVKPAGMYICYYHKGSFETIEQANNTILAYAEKHHYKIADFFYERLLLNESVVKTSDEFVTELSIQVLP